jgi:hypothetical protein
MSLSGVKCPKCKGTLHSESITSSGFTSGLRVVCGTHGEVSRVSINVGGKTESFGQIMDRIKESLRPKAIENFELKSASIMKDGSFGVAGVAKLS